MKTKPYLAPPLMPRAERLALIRAPFYSQRISSKSWGGVNLGNTVKDQDVNTWSYVSPDEEVQLIEQLGLQRYRCSGRSHKKVKGI